MGEPSLDGDAGVVLVMTGAGGVAMVRESSDASKGRWRIPPKAGSATQSKLKIMYVRILMGIAVERWLWKLGNTVYQESGTVNVCGMMI
jgi:hypothetical protein